jgi:hypothetical protein
MILFGTTDEFEELQTDIARLFAKYMDRISDPMLRPEGSHVFEFQLFTHPIDPSPFVLGDEPVEDES